MRIVVESSFISNRGPHLTEISVPLRNVELPKNTLQCEANKIAALVGEMILITTMGSNNEWVQKDRAVRVYTNVNTKEVLSVKVVP